MTDMNEPGRNLSEAERQERVHARALASIAAEKRKSEAHGYAVLASAISIGTAAGRGGTFAKISHGAKLFCIGFAFLVPSLLVWRVLL